MNVPALQVKLHTKDPELKCQIRRKSNYRLSQQKVGFTHQWKMKNWKIIENYFTKKQKYITFIHLFYIYVCVCVCVCIYIYRKDIEIFVKKNVFLIFI